MFHSPRARNSALTAIIIGLAICAVPLISALAQAIAVPQSQPVQLNPLWATLRPYLYDAASIVLTALGSWVLLKIKDKTGVDLDAKYRDSLHQAIFTGVNAALGRLDKVVDKKNLSVDLKNDIANFAANWAISSVPDALKWFGITPESARARLQSLIDSKLHVIMTAQTTTATVQQLQAPAAPLGAPPSA